MKTVLRILAILIVLAIGVYLYFGSGLFTKTEVGTPYQTIPKSSSEELGVYLYAGNICDAEGQFLSQYVLDGSGNIVDNKGTVVVSFKNVKNYTCISKLVLQDETLLNQAIPAEKEGEQVLIIGEVRFRVKFSAESMDAVNRKLVLESSDPFGLYFPYDENRSIVAPETPIPADNVLSSFSVLLDDSGELELTLAAKLDGEFTVKAKNCFEEPVGSFTFKLTPEVQEEPETTEVEGEQTEETAGHVHEYVEEVIAPTYSSQGYTVHTCKICGASYRDSYTDKLGCDHEYVDTVVPPTYTSGGYTRHVCKKCGDVYYDHPTEQLYCSHPSYSERIVQPTCTEGGYTLHECTVCHEDSYTDNPTPALGHDWDAGVVTLEATCGTDGVRTFTCRRCGETRTEVLPASGAHSYTEQTIAATCTEGGCTLRTCTVCGHTERENETPALGHSWDSGTVVQAATCGTDGTMRYTCQRCGETREESIAATGDHQLTVTETVPPTCTEEGYIVSTCSQCGQQIRQTFAALGHDWVEEYDQETGALISRRCSRCGAEG